MGLLVKVAQNVEDRVSPIGQQSGRKIRLRLREAKSGWLNLKSRSKRSGWEKTELRTRAGLTRIDARIRHSAGQVIARVIVKLETLRRRLVRPA